MTRKPRGTGFSLCFLALAAGTLSAATSTAWEMNTYSDFIRGRFTGVSLEREGRLALAPRLDTVFYTGQPVIWSVAQAPDGSVYLATGHRGRLYKTTPAGVSSLIWTSDQPEIFAVTVDSRGAVYAATAPDGKVYRIENGKANEVFAPKAKYIWSLAVAPNGDLFVGAGEPGNVYRVNKSGTSEVYYESGQAHITSLAIDGAGQLLAGSEPNGILYRISAKDKAFVLYDSSLPEIRSILPMPDGSIYVAALGGSLAGRSGPLANALTSLGNVVVTAPATSITVTDSQAGPDLKPKPDATRAAQAAPTVTMAATSLTELTGVEKSALYRINPDLTVETLWSSKEENAYGLAVQADGRILLSTDGDGRIYGLSTDRKPVLLVQTNEGEATRLLSTSNGLLAATGDMGKLYRLADSTTTPSGKYESPVHDSNSVARWGRVTWRSSGGAIRLETRTGNSTRPDNTWSDWAAPVNELVKSPNARFIQWRAELSGTGAALENVSISYLPQNNPPIVRSVSVTSQGSAAQKPAATASNAAAYSITVTDTGEAPSTSSGTPSQTVSRSGGSQILVSWQADDPDGDKLSYSLYFRGEDEREWKLLRGNMQDNSLLLDGDIFADGRYYFRVAATDRPSNAKEYAKEAEQISAPVLIDNTPPAIKLSAPRRTDRHVEVDVEAVDQLSPLRRCEYSLDAGAWMVVEAADGVTDGPREDFHIVLDGVRPGEHLLVVRVFDSGGNAGLGKVVLR
jgi:sugar lactone lactonase YvrE